MLRPVVLGIGAQVFILRRPVVFNVTKRYKSIEMEKTSEPH